MLSGKSALVTGGSRGLGRALGKALVRAGCRVVLAARSDDALERAVVELRTFGGEVYGIRADVADKQGTHVLAGQAAALVGPIDILIQNASSLGPVPLRPLLDLECEELESVLQTNLVGPFRLAKVIVGAMALRGEGTVVNVSSDAAVVPYAEWGAYGVSKAALDHLTRIWARELNGSGVRLVSVDPGEMDTDMHRAAMPDAERASLADPDVIAGRIVAELARESLQSGSRWAVQEAS